jgi:aminoglycoside phosphotransferase (APT) family kinase protein
LDIRDFYGWVSNEVGPGARVISVTDLTQVGYGSGPWRFEVALGSSTIRLILHAAPERDRSAIFEFDVHRAALELASSAGIQAPRFVAMDTGSVDGRVVLLQTALPGNSRIPQRPDPVRLRTLGRALGSIHGVFPGNDSGLPRRSRSLEGVDFSVIPVPASSADLFARAHVLTDDASPAPGKTVFVHGDLWQGNTMWESGVYQGAIDWDCAGVGPAGIDLGSLRLDVAVMYGSTAADEVSAGWKESTGRSPEDVAYWDVVSCLCSPPDLSYWLPNFHHQGRTDLSLDLVTARRDAHMSMALGQLL